MSVVETLRREVSDRHDICVGWTIEGMTVRRRCPLEDTYKNLETLRKRVCDNQNGCSGQTIVGMMVKSHVSVGGPLEKTNKRVLEQTL